MNKRIKSFQSLLLATLAFFFLAIATTDAQPTPAPLNVRNFGAVGNGVADDTNALNNTIAAAQAKHLSVYVPAGTYLYTSTLVLNGIQLFGDGSASILQMKDIMQIAVELTGNGSGLSNVQVTYVPAPRFNLIGPLGACIQVLAATNCSVKQVTVNGVGGSDTTSNPISSPGIIVNTMSGHVRLAITDCVIQNCGRGLDVEAVSLAGGDLASINVLRNSFNCGLQAIYASGNQPKSKKSAPSLAINISSNNIIGAGYFVTGLRPNGDAIDIFYANANVNGNTINPTYQAIGVTYLMGGPCNFSNNHIFGYTKSESVIYLYYNHSAPLASPPKSVTITNNTYAGTWRSGVIYGIYCDYSRRITKVYGNVFHPPVAIYVAP